ncbi:lactococcin 972 family bacteriocin [Streptomyces sp. NPDC088736]|uniref:lactococcin 972 family bacteriocin n=1 Tax=Streptomyces sp. NPDC088736 TaxID=3365881 RepID=UPI003808CDF8
MKISGKSIAIAVAGGFLAAGALAAPATAVSAGIPAADGVTVTTHHRGDGTQPPAALGDPKEWGVLEFTTGSTGEFTPMTVLDIGGGTWSYGKNLTTDGQYCYSNYYHPTVKHGSTVQVSSWEDKQIVAKGLTSFASITAGAAYTCKTYYSKY